MGLVDEAAFVAAILKAVRVNKVFVPDTLVQEDFSVTRRYDLDLCGTWVELNRSPADPDAVRVKSFVVEQKEIER